MGEREQSVLASTKTAKDRALAGRRDKVQHNLSKNFKELKSLFKAVN